MLQRKTSFFDLVLHLHHIKLNCTFAEIFIMQKIILLISILCSCFALFAQNSVQYDIDPAIEKIQSDYIATWQKIGETDGFRIQIGALTGANSKPMAESESASFTSQFPDIPVYITYLEPFFRIRVGNFSTRLEAYKVLLEIQTIYPGAYIISDKIQYLEN